MLRRRAIAAGYHFLLAVIMLGAETSTAAQSAANPPGAQPPAIVSSPVPAQAGAAASGGWALLATLPPFVGGLWTPADQTLAETIALDNIAYPPLRPELLTKSKHAVQDIIDGKTDQPSAGCKPPGIPWSLWYAYWHTFLYAPGAVIMITPGVGVRTIATDGSSLPSSLSDANSLMTPPTDVGYSVGHWEGDTLVVETRGLSATNLVAHGVPNEGGMSIVERYRLVQPDRLELRMTVDAPKVFTRPWEVHREFTRTPMSRISDGRCDPTISREKLDANGNLSLDLTPPSEQKH